MAELGLTATLDCVDWLSADTGQTDRQTDTGQTDGIFDRHY